jgi:hypothetical protein
MRHSLFLALSCALLAALCALPAAAGMAEAKDMARAYNCKVTSLTAVETETGDADGTTYKATCQLDGTLTDEQKKANGTLYIRCDMAMCRLLRKGE